MRLQWINKFSNAYRLLNFFTKLWKQSNRFACSQFAVIFVLTQQPPYDGAGTAEPSVLSLPLFFH